MFGGKSEVEDEVVLVIVNEKDSDMEVVGKKTWGCVGVAKDVIIIVGVKV